MCYDIKTSLEKQLRRALLDGNSDNVSEILEKLKIFSNDEIELNHVSGFSHPRLFIYTHENPFEPIIATWGLIPEWANEQESKSLWNKTLNARGETILEKPSFKTSAESKRCIIHLEGFYEHHHKLGQKFPFFIQDKEKDLITVAGLYSQWVSPSNGEQLTTFTIVTSKADNLMVEIHNNPKLKEPRMPRILTEAEQEVWMSESTTSEQLLELIGQIDSNTPSSLKAHSVGPIRGANASGNSPVAINPVNYAVLESGEQLDLF